MAALAGQVLAVGEDARRPAALQRQPRVDEGGGSAVVVHKERLRAETVHTRNALDYNNETGTGVKRLRLIGLL